MENQCIAQMIYFQCTKIKLESISQIEYVRNEINHTVDRPHVSQLQYVVGIIVLSILYIQRCKYTLQKYLFWQFPKGLTGEFEHYNLL